MVNKRAPANPSDSSQWLILNGVENATRRKHLMGSVVPKAAIYTLDNYRPHWDDDDLDTFIVPKQEKHDGTHKTKRDVLAETIQKLWTKKGDYGKDEATEDPPVQLNDILTGKKMATSKASQTSITKLFNLVTKKDDIEQVKITSASVKRYRIDNPFAKVQDTLMPCVPWKEQLQKLLDGTIKQKSTYMLITGILVCEDLTVSWDLAHDAKIDAGVKMDGKVLLAALSLPANPGLAEYLDSKFEFKREENTSQNIFATCKQDVIIAIRYNYLNLDYDPPDKKENSSFLSKLLNRSSKKGVIKTATLGDVVLGTGINSFASSSLPKKSTAEEDDDWFYNNPALDNEEDEASNGQLNGHTSGHTRTERQE